MERFKILALACMYHLAYGVGSAAGAVASFTTVKLDKLTGKVDTEAESNAYDKLVTKWGIN